MQALKTFIRPVAGLAIKRSIQTSSVASMPIKVGDKLPAIDLFEGAPDTKVNTGADLSSGKTVIFGVPGAFTPTCNNDHVPGFLSMVDDLKSKGVNHIACVAVNDPFVMAAWGKALDPSGKMKYLADTCGDFTKAIDLAFDVTAVLGNVRCKRFAMVVQDGVVTAINIEPDGAGLSCSRAVDVLKMI